MLAVAAAAAGSSSEADPCDDVYEDDDDDDDDDVDAMAAWRDVPTLGDDDDDDDVVALVGLGLWFRRGCFGGVVLPLRQCDDDGPAVWVGGENDDDEGPLLWCDVGDECAIGGVLFDDGRPRRRLRRRSEPAERCG